MDNFGTSSSVRSALTGSSVTELVVFMKLYCLLCNYSSARRRIWDIGSITSRSILDRQPCHISLDKSKLDRTDRLQALCGKPLFTVQLQLHNRTILQNQQHNIVEYFATGNHARSDLTGLVASKPCPFMKLILLNVQSQLHKQTICNVSSTTL